MMHQSSLHNLAAVGLSIKIISQLFIVPYPLILIVCNDVSQIVLISRESCLLSVWLPNLIAHLSHRTHKPSFTPHGFIIIIIIQFKYLILRESNHDANALSDRYSKLCLCEMIVLWGIIVIRRADQWRLSRITESRSPHTCHSVDDLRHELKGQFFPIRNGSLRRP